MGENEIRLKKQVFGGVSIFHVVVSDEFDFEKTLQNLIEG